MVDEVTARASPLEQLVAAWRGLRPDLEPVAFSILIHIGHLSIAFGRILQSAAERFGIGQSDVRLLMAIKRDQGGNPVRPSELGVRLALTRATITYRVDRLLDLGLAERLADPSDRRSLFVRLTAKGEDVLREVMTLYAAASEEKLRDIDLGGARETLESALATIAARFQDDWPMVSADGAAASDLHPKTAIRGAQDEANAPGSR